MNRIRLLPEYVASQIAAGEVIERPASVVKELVENALDAQASWITVEIQAGGRSLIRVTDDGIGMSKDDALLSLERHATSKIRSAEDLFAINTLGFRGEALPSIASVSRLTLITRERSNESAEGTQVIVSGGKIVEVKVAGCPPGTSVEVRQLFFNVPARRKFLKSDETEAAHIQQYIMLAALAFPEVGFKFVKDGRVVWQLPAAKCGPEIESRLAAVRERLRVLQGEERLLQVNSSGELSIADVEELQADSSRTNQTKNRKSEIRLWGFIGAPGVSRATRQDQHLFVNRRPIENRGLNAALLEGYHTALMKGRYPVCCLFLEIDPAAVDVNIHPSKREVKFHRESAVRQFVTRAVRDALLNFHAAPAQSHARPKASPQVTPPRTAGTQPTAQPLDTQSPHEQLKPVPIGPKPTLPEFQLAPEQQTSEPQQPVLRIGFAQKPPLDVSCKTTVALSHTPEHHATELVPGVGLVSILDVPLRFVGVIGRLYVVFESDRGLVLLDQHAAHERVLFEQMLARLEQDGIAPSQRLLLPETIELAPRDAQFVREHIAVLVRLGVGLSEFGERTFLLDALPPFVKASEPRRFVLDLIDELKAAGKELSSIRLGEQTVAKTVCRLAVKAHDPLSESELERLVEDLRKCAMPYTCPHGRPTMIEINYRELERKFGRTQ